MPKKPDSHDGKPQEQQPDSPDKEVQKPQGWQSTPTFIDRLKKLAGIPSTSNPDLNGSKPRFSNRTPRPDIESTSRLYLDAISEENLITYVRDSEDEETVNTRSLMEQIINKRNEPGMRKALEGKPKVIKSLVKCQPLGIATFIGTNRHKLSGFVLEQEFTAEEIETPSTVMSLSGFLYRLNVQLKKILDEAEGEIPFKPAMETTTPDKKCPEETAQSSDSENADDDFAIINRSSFLKMDQAGRWYLAKELRQAIKEQLKKAPVNVHFILELLKDLGKIEEMYLRDFGSSDPPAGVEDKEINGNGAEEKKKLQQLVTAAENRAKRAEDRAKRAEETVIDVSGAVQFEGDESKHAFLKRTIFELRMEILRLNRKAKLLEAEQLSEKVNMDIRDSQIDDLLLQLKTYEDANHEDLRDFFEKQDSIRASGTGKTAETEDKTSGLADGLGQNMFMFELRTELAELLEQLNKGTDQPATNIQHDIYQDEYETEGQLEKTNEELSKELRDATATIQDLENQLEELFKTYDGRLALEFETASKLRQAAQAEETRTAVARREAEHYKGEYKALAVRLRSEFEQQDRQRDKEITDLRDSLTSVQGERDSLLSASSDRVIENEDEIREAKAQIKKLDELNAKLEGWARAAIWINAEMKQELSALQKLADELKTKNSGQEETIRLKTQEIERIYGEKRGTAVKVAEEIAKLQRELADITSRRDNLRRQLEESFRDVEGLTGRLASEKERADGLQNEKDRLLGELETERNQVIFLENQFEAANTKLQHQSGEMQQMDAHKREAIETVTKLEEALKKSKGRVQELEGQLELANTALRTKTEAIDGMAKEKEKITEYISGMERWAKQLEQEKTDAITAADGLRAERDNLTVQIGEKERRLEEARKEITDLKSKLTEAVNKLNAVSADKNGSEEAIREATRCIENLQRQLREANQAKEGAENTATGLRDQLREKIEALSSANQQLEQINQELVSANQRAGSEEQRAKGLQEERDELIRKIGEQDERFRKTQEAIAVFEGLIQTLQGDVQAASSRADTQKQRADELENERDNLNTELSGKETVLAGAGERIAELERQIQGLQNDLQSANERTGSKADGSGQESDKMRTQIDHKYTSITQAEKTISGLEQQVKNMDEQIRTLQNDLQSANERADQENKKTDKLDDQITNLHERLRSADNRADTLGREKTNAETIASELRRQLDLAKSTADDERKIAEELADRVGALMLRVDELNDSLDEAHRQLLKSGKKVRIFESQETMAGNTDSGEYSDVDDGELQLVGTASSNPPGFERFGERPTLPPKPRSSRKSARPRPQTSSQSEETAYRPGETAHRHMHTIFGPTTVPAGQTLELDVLKNIPNHIVSVEDGATVIINKAFAGATIKLLSPNAKWEIRQKIGNTQKNPIRVIHHDGMVEEVK